jgi:hypothetical protein
MRGACALTTPMQEARDKDNMALPPPGTRRGARKSTNTMRQATKAMIDTNTRDRPERPVVVDRRQEQLMRGVAVSGGETLASLRLRVRCWQPARHACHRCCKPRRLCAPRPQQRLARMHGLWGGGLLVLYVGMRGARSGPRAAPHCQLQLHPGPWSGLRRRRLQGETLARTAWGCRQGLGSNAMNPNPPWFRSAAAPGPRQAQERSPTLLQVSRAAAYPPGPPGLQGGGRGEGASWPWRPLQPGLHDGACPAGSSHAALRHDRQPRGAPAGPSSRASSSTHAVPIAVALRVAVLVIVVAVRAALLGLIPPAAVAPAAPRQHPYLQHPRPRCV